MVKYVTMKRITQILASVLFIITVLTIYLAFDFAINNAVSHKQSSHKHSDHQHHDDIKITKRRSVSPEIKKSNRTMKHHVDQEHPISNNASRTHKSKKQGQNIPLRAKPGSFHKGKTGVKVNKPRKNMKNQRKGLTTTTTSPQHKVKHQLNVQ
ncbi:hypothetical protein I4U23_028846 [Adineta vaga]|nr:hypothetical protein I4U23_028846 [Adineta vaga]